ncbi:MAG: Polyprenyl synthetase [Firmicutes bacterium]|nr:Polyprenyl synthetase [Bacillota bacterium]
MLKGYLKTRAALVEEMMDSLVPAQGVQPPIIFEAMRYSLFAGGKRLRPILLMASAEAVGADGKQFLHVASGLEMVHTYSLIHDDLPAMDDDDYRRGKLTNHKVYGEGIAILAGDGLLTAAFQAILEQPGIDAGVLLAVAQEVATASGAYGMVGGQALDLISEGKMINSDTLCFMHRAKTGALFRGAVRSGAILAKADPEQLAALTRYSEQFGLAFQITDDILDVVGTQESIGKPVGSDEKNQKATYVSLYSLEQARMMAQTAVDEALAALSVFGPTANVLRELVKQLIARDH